MSYIHIQSPSQLAYSISVDPEINQQTDTRLTKESYYTSESGTRTSSGSVLHLKNVLDHTKRSIAFFSKHFLAITFEQSKVCYSH